MKFLHIGDLHLGKTLHQKSLIEDQRGMIGFVINTAVELKVSAVVIAGDIYDKAMPPLEAVELFDELITSLSKKNIVTLVISGNHDSRNRLNYASKLLSEQKVYIRSEVDDRISHYVLNDEYGEVYFYLQPYIHKNDISANHKDIKTYDDAFSFLINNSDIDFSKRNVLVAHQFFTSSGNSPERSESENIVIGGLDNIDCKKLRFFNYVALGHLHKGQRVGYDYIRYAGTLLKYSFSEAMDKKQIVVVDMDKDGAVHIDFVPYKPKIDLKIVKGKLEEILLGAGSNDYVKVELTDTELMEEPVSKLKAVFPNFMALEYTKRNTAYMDKGFGKNIKKSSHRDIVEEFYKQQYGFCMKSSDREFLEEIFLELEGELL